MKIFKQNFAACAAKTLSLGVLSVWLLSCEKGAVAPAEEAKPLSSGPSETSSGELNASVLYHCVDTEMFYKISGANADAPKPEQILVPNAEISLAPHRDILTMDKSKDQLYCITWQGLVRINTDGSGFVKLADLPNKDVKVRSLKCDGKNLYWIEVLSDIPYTAHIIKADLSGQNRKIIYKGRPITLAEPLDGKIYFQDKLYNAVCSIDTNGFFLKVVTKNTFILYSGQLCVNGVTKKMYWLKYGSSVICSANLDGTGYKEMGFGPDSPSIIEIDPSGKFLYYAENIGDINQRIVRLDLDKITIKVIHEFIPFDAICGMVVK